MTKIHNTTFWLLRGSRLIFSCLGSPIGPRPGICEFPRSHSDTPHSLWLPWTSDRPIAETSTLQHKHSQCLPGEFGSTIPANQRP